MRTNASEVLDDSTHILSIQPSPLTWAKLEGLRDACHPSDLN